jgi:GT2 family glycosyltransferase
MLPFTRTSAGHVTIGVPVYHGERWLEETLRSIQQQTHREFDVIMSVDGPDPACESICERFASDSRFHLVVQPQRLGWNGNINWLMKQVSGEYWYFHQQDDLTADNYLEVLLAHARQHPAAALVYCDLVPFGRIEGSFDQPASVRGASPFIRLLTFLHEHYPAFALRGLTSAAAVRSAGDIPSNEFGGFGADICWVAAVARSGEIHHVPLPLYRKRYHDRNTESAFWAMSRETRIAAWALHCAQMLETALHVDGTVEQARLLWLAAVERLTSPRSAGGILPLADLSPAERSALLGSFLRRARALTVHDIPVLLDADWPEIVTFTEEFWRVPPESHVEILAFGPNPVHGVERSRVAADARAAVWVRVSRRPNPTWALRLGGILLQSAVGNDTLTAVLPSELTDRVAELELVVVAADGQPRSQPVVLQVIGSNG